MGPANPGAEAEERSNAYFCGHGHTCFSVAPCLFRATYTPCLPHGQRLVLDVSTLAGGIYVVEVIGAEGREMGRLVVR